MTSESKLLDVEEVYISLLVQMDSISPCDEQFTKFLLNDIDLEKHIIKVQIYWHVIDNAFY